MRKALAEKRIGSSMPAHAALSSSPAQAAKLVVVEPRSKQVRFGRYAGQIRVADDFDEPLEDFAEYM